MTATSSEDSFASAMFNWLDPFELNLWLTFLACVICSGLVMFGLERRHWKPLSEHGPQEDGSDFEGGLSQCKAKGLFQGLLLSWYHWTGAGGFAPLTTEGNIFVASWSFVILILVASYTANLAAFLTTQPTITYSVDSLSTARLQQLPVCVIAGGHSSRILALMFTNPALNVFPVHSSHDAVEAIRNGSCTCAIIEKLSAEEKIAQDKSCDLTTVGDSILYMGGGFITAPYITETSPGGGVQICHNPAVDVFGALIMDLEEEGVIQELHDNYIAEITTATCGAAAGTGTSKLDVKELSGIFFIHLGVTIMVIVWRAVKLCRQGVQGDNTPEESEEPKTDEHEILRTLLTKVENIENHMLANATLTENILAIKPDSPADQQSTAKGLCPYCTIRVVRYQCSVVSTVLLQLSY